MTPDYWHTAKKHLSKRDKTLKKIIAAYDGEMMVKRGDAFYTLARSIAGQQISVKAADSVWNKLVTLTKITPNHLKKLSDEQIRTCGFSGQKVKYLRALCEYFSTPRDLAHMSDDEVIRELTSIHGIGRWTAEMYLIFHLGRPDVLPLGDIGLLKAIYLHYNRGEKLPLGEVRKLAEDWQPYRSVATWYLWRSLDPVPVSY